MYLGRYVAFLVVDNFVSAVGHRKADSRRDSVALWVVHRHVELRCKHTNEAFGRYTTNASLAVTEAYRQPLGCYLCSKGTVRLPTYVPFFLYFFCCSKKSEMNARVPTP